MPVHFHRTASGLLVLGLSLMFCQSNGQRLLAPTDMQPEQLKPALLYWDYGDPQYLTIETIYPHEDSLRSYWNITHRNPSPRASDGNGYDFYSIDSKTLRPVKSHMYHHGYIDYAINFESEVANITISKTGDTINYQVRIPDLLAPEGPGTPVFLGSLPLAPGLYLQYYELNRWTGKEPKTAQLELTDLRVIGEDLISINERKVPTYMLIISTKSGRYTKIWALKEAPHYWVKVQHRISEKEMQESKVTRLILLEN